MYKMYKSLVNLKCHSFNTEINTFTFTVHYFIAYIRFGQLQRVRCTFCVLKRASLVQSAMFQAV